MDPAFSIGTPCSIGDVEYKKQGGVSIEDPCEDSMLQGTDDEENKEQNAENIIGPASQMENTSTNEIRAIESTDVASIEDPYENSKLQGTYDAENKK